MVDKLVKIFSDMEYKAFVDVFGGSGRVIMSMSHPASITEVFNDVDKDVVNAMRVCRSHPEELARQFDYILCSRDEWYRFKKMNPDQLTDIQRAARYIFLLRQSFASKGTTYGYGLVGKGARYTNTNMEKIVRQVSERLSRVQIECLDFYELVERYDRPTTLFYFDPPYEEYELKYGRNMFLKNDYDLLGDLCRSIKGKCVVTINTSPTVLSAFSGLNVYTVDTIYTANIDRVKTVQEYIFSNVFCDNGFG